MPAQVESPLRVDARRNREAVIEAALSLLAERPAATMQEIADASAVGRATVYRHFPSREDLIISLYGHVIEEARVSTARIIDRGEGVEETIRALAAGMLEIGQRFRFLRSQRHVASEILDESKFEDSEPVRDYLIARMEQGEIRSDQPVSWLQATIQSLAFAAVDEIRAGRMDQRQATEALGTSLVAILLPAR